MLERGRVFLSCGVWYGLWCVVLCVCVVRVCACGVWLWWCVVYVSERVCLEDNKLVYHHRMNLL